jgi:hypothetical protein
VLLCSAVAVEMANICGCAVSHRITQGRAALIAKVVQAASLVWCNHCACDMQAAELVEKIRLLGGLVIKDRSYHFKNYKMCFVGKGMAHVCVSYTNFIHCIEW